MTNAKQLGQELDQALKILQAYLVYGLLQAGLVEIVRPEGMPPPRPVAPTRPGARPVPTPDPKQQVSVVTKLIARIRSL